jgi:cobalt-zinc-cadmium efflux system membrane fusion protein
VKGEKKYFFLKIVKHFLFVEYDTVRTESIEAALSAPASVAVTITASNIGNKYIVLFDNPALEATYAQFLQHLININTYKINLSRVVDLSHHGASSGKEVLEAETLLNNEIASSTQHEGELKIEGLEPSELKNPKSQQAWIIAQVPETQIKNIKVGTSCKLEFTSFPNEVFNGKVDGLGADVDNITRMNKVRIVLPNTSGKFQVGMYGKVNFELKTSESFVIPIQAIVNVEGKDFAFTKTGTTSFERREILAGIQSKDKVVVLKGLNAGDIVAIKGTMALKGISFGY